jgi:hypothetical protein
MSFSDWLSALMAISGINDWELNYDRQHWVLMLIIRNQDDSGKIVLIKEIIEDKLSAPFSVKIEIQ